MPPPAAFTARLALSKRLWLAFLLPCLAPWAPAAVADAVDASDWTAMVSPRGQLFPSLVVATATMASEADATARGVIGDAHGVVGVTLTARRAGEAVRVTVSLPGLARESVLEARLPEAGRRYELYPLVQWDYARLRALRQPAPETVVFRLERDGEPAGTRSERVRVRAINDVPYAVRDADGVLDLAWMFAAYVNEDHPLVEKVLKDALESGIVDRFDGYQSGDPGQVYRQVFAIWNVLQRRGIRYSAIQRTSSVDDAVLSQHVRFLDESWDNGQANCVDGSVLLASILRRIDLNPTLVLVPGHMLLGFDLDPGGRQRTYLESTRLGSVPRHGNGQLRGLTDGLGGDVDEERSLESFEGAVEQGRETVDAARGHFDDPRDVEYRLIDIAAARRRGVMPIAAPDPS